MNISKLFKNSSFSVLQTIITAATALIIFKLMAAELGLAITGVWAYLSSVVAITGFGSFGFSNALLFFIPRFLSSNQEHKISPLINTTLCSIFGLTSLLCIIAYLIFHFTIPFTVENPLVPLAKLLLPFVLLSFFFSGLSSTYLSVLDGMMLMHVRAKITIASTLIFLILGFLFINKFGVIGVPLAQTAQNIFLLIAGFFFVRRHQPNYSLLKGISKPVFKEVFKYGFNFQLISLTQILADPFIKSMITKFAGTANTAIFDIIVKILGAVRGVIISANQAIVPQVTIFNTLNRKRRLATFYKTNFKIILLLGMLLFFTPLALSDLFVTLIFHTETFNSTFILFNVSLALFINALAFPAHFQYLGKGNLKWLVINNSVTAFLMLVSAPLIGFFAGGVYVVMAWSAPTVIGPLLLMRVFSKEHNVSTLKMFDKNAFLMFFALVFVACINQGLSNWNQLRYSKTVLFSVQVVVFASIMAYPVFSNVTLKKILIRIRYRYAK